MKTLSTFPDPEKATRALLDAITPGPTTVGIGVPTDWTPASPPHLQVIWAGTIVPNHRLTETATVRITAWAATTTEAKRLALDAEGRLCAHDGSGEIAVIQPAAGVFPARDPDTRAELASLAVRVSVRSIPLT